jgi:translation initiation factor 2B subunit (eIF-2B alpha/beta/delta family)
LRKKLDTLVTSKKPLHAENETLRKTTTSMLEQLKTTEQRVTDRFAEELKAKAEQLQKETIKTASLNTLVSNLKDSEGTSKKEVEKLKNENRLMSVKYKCQASEYATTFTVCA